MIYTSGSRGAMPRPLPHAAHRAEALQAAPALDAVLDGLLLFVIVAGLAAGVALFSYAAWLLLVAEVAR